MVNPEYNETFLSNALLQCIRTWKERVGEAPLILTWEDIDQLYDWVNNLQAHVERARQCQKELDTIEVPPERLLNED